jgi:hypothetical protein
MGGRSGVRQGALTVRTPALQKYKHFVFHFAMGVATGTSYVCVVRVESSSLATQNRSWYVELTHSRPALNVSTCTCITRRFVYVCLHVRVYYKRICLCVCVYMYAYYKRICLCVCVYMYAYYKRICLCVCVYMYAYYKRICLCVCVYE